MDISAWSKLGLGSLTISAWQKNFSPSQAADLIEFACKSGINWIDTAEEYQNYELIRAGLDRLEKKPALVSKTYAYDKKAASFAVKTALKDLNLPYLDALMLHEQESTLTLEGHSEAFAYLKEARSEGKIKYLGVSTHSIEVVRALTEAKLKKPDGLWQGLNSASLYQDCDLVFTLLSPNGIGILDGSIKEMEEACSLAKEAGLIVLGMKVFAGGHLQNKPYEAISYARSLDFVHSFAIGMRDRAEITANVRAFSEELEPNLFRKTQKIERRIEISSYCTACAACTQRCKSGAIKIIKEQAVVDYKLCINCSYCASVCRDFAIKMV